MKSRSKVCLWVDRVETRISRSIFTRSRALACAVIALVATNALAQVRRGGAQVNETTQIINDCVRRANTFKKTLDRALARDNVRAGQAREDQLNRDASRLADQLNKVGDSWNRDHSLDRTREHVHGAIALANDINVAMRSWNMGGDAESQWAAVRTELNRLAQKFGLPRIR
jgi:hypothetical protein